MNTLTETASKQVEQVSSATRELMAQSVSPNTLRVYKTALDALTTWLTTHARELSDSAIADYLTILHHAGKSVARINLVLAAVNWGTKLLILPSPVGSRSTTTMKGIRRKQAKRPIKQATAIDWSNTLTFSRMATQSNSIQDLRASAIISLASDCLLRRSEIADIQVSDLTREPDSSGRLTIRRSKTDQFGEGTTLYVGESTMNLIETWINRAGIVDGALFRSLNKAGIASSKPLSAQSVGTIIKQSAQSIGIEGASGHSLRVGSAQELVRNGASLGELMQAGRWTTERMPAHYAKAELAGRGAIARLKYAA